MSIRNKRIKKELPNLNKYNLILENNWEEQDIVTIKYKCMNTLFDIKINNKYPFHYPKTYINNIEYIDWFIINKNKYNLIKKTLNIKLGCICCKSITCNWYPTMTISNIIEELENHYSQYYKIIQINEIYNKIISFDNLIYKKIFDFLY